MLLPRENAHFVHGPVPLVLLGGAPVHTSLPPLHAPGGRMPTCDGWSIAARLTLCLIDGPGDAGCVVPTLPPSEEPDAIGAWCDGVARAGGAVVVSLDELPSEVDEPDWEGLFTGGRARGGFVHAM
ncbi:hypothetical protein [Streptomyces sp. NPDC001070]